MLLVSFGVAAHRALHAAADGDVAGAERGAEGHDPAPGVVVVRHDGLLLQAAVVEAQRVVPPGRQHALGPCKPRARTQR